MTTTIRIDESYIDNMLKEILTEGIQIDEAEEEKTKVYSKVSGVPNLGRTYFCCKNEIDDKNQVAQFQLAQTFGNEIYGTSGQNSRQHAQADMLSKTASGSAIGNEGSGLIKCNFYYFTNIRDKKKEDKDRKKREKEKEKAQKNGGIFGEASTGYMQFSQAWDKFKQFVSGKDKNWQSQHKKQMDSLTKIKSQFRELSGAEDPNNKKLWVQMCDVFKSNPFKDSIASDPELKKSVETLNTGYKSWGSGQQGGFGKDGQAGQIDGEKWDPNAVFKIDIQTNFNDQWFTKKFKSGLLNAAIRAIKNDARARSTEDDPMHGHKYTQDEMLPQDQRKLDSIQWKMTNKVAKEYVSALLGWTRAKEKDENGKPTKELALDEGFGSSMAKKALNNRGILNRIAQKVFSGGQSNNVISVCFQLADPAEFEVMTKNQTQPEREIDTGDGEEKENPSEPDSEKSTEKKPDTHPKQIGVSQQKTSASSGQEDADFQDEPEQQNESRDPFAGVFDELDNDRRDLVLGVCSGTRTIDELIDRVM